jgi:hypothetical protein
MAKSSGRFPAMTTPELAEAKQAVLSASTEIAQVFGHDHLRLVPDGQGGLWAEINEIRLGDPYVQETSFVICLLPFNLPAADVYPLFLRSDLSRSDGRALGEGFQATAVSWPGDAQPRPVVQVSRRTRGNAFTLQTPRQKIEKVLDWVRNQ